MTEKQLNIAHTLASSIVSNPEILKDDSFLWEIPDRIEMTGEDRKAYLGMVRVAVRAARPLTETEFSIPAFNQSLAKLRGRYVPELRAAMMWAASGADSAQKVRQRRPQQQQEASVDYSEAAAMDVFLG